jgi:hypothetical protein
MRRPVSGACLTPIISRAYRREPLLKASVLTLEFGAAMDSVDQE